MVTPLTRHFRLGRPCEVGKENTMIFDTECEIRVNHDHELVALCQELAPASIPGKEDDEPILH